jgi:membrane associated rhomboid family serine protease
MFEPTLFRDRSRRAQIVLIGAVPAAAGAIAGVLVGVSSSAYWAYGGLLALAVLAGGFEHEDGWSSAARGCVGGLIYGIALLLMHAIVGTDAKVSLGSFPPGVAVVTAIAGALLSALGARVARLQRERRTSGSR